MQLFWSQIFGVTLATAPQPRSALCLSEWGHSLEEDFSGSGAAAGRRGCGRLKGPGVNWENAGDAG